MSLVQIVFSLNEIFTASPGPYISLGFCDALILKPDVSTCSIGSNQIALLMIPEYTSHLGWMSLLALPTLVCCVASWGLFCHFPFCSHIYFPSFSPALHHYISQIPWAAHFWVKLTRERGMERKPEGERKGKVTISPFFLFFFLFLRYSVAIPAFPPWSLVQPVNCFLWHLRFCSS